MLALGIGDEFLQGTNRITRAGVSALIWVNPIFGGPIWVVVDFGAEGSKLFEDQIPTISGYC